jgi:hypothetical protein
MTITSNDERTGTCLWVHADERVCVCVREREREKEREREREREREPK